MTSDHDPRELRATAMKIYRNLNDSQAACTLADYILATVRDDDGEEQPDTWVGVLDGEGIVSVSEHGVWLRTRDSFGTVPLLRKRPTRGQFRDLCRGLGITPAAATPETPG